MTEQVVIYHAGCDDGFGAAWAAWRLMGDGARYVSANYGEPMPEIPAGAHVHILDFSYPRADLVALHDRLEDTGGSLTVLDHHKTAAADLDGLPFATFDMDKSGARLAWEWFHGGPVPGLILHVEDRDLWRFALADTRPITAWLRSYPREFVFWEEMADRLAGSRGERATVIVEGHAILRANAQHTDAHVRAARLVDFDGQRVPCVNATMLQSEIGAALCAKHPDAPFSLTYFDRDDGRRVWSLRTRRDDIDVSAVAKPHGGGGHRAAAGFTTETSWWPA